MNAISAFSSTRINPIDSESKSKTLFVEYNVGNCSEFMEFHFQTQGYIALNDIRNLKDNWNGNGAESFSPDMIGHCYHLLNLFSYSKIGLMAFVVPTATRAIQFQFERGNLYLEFEVHDDRISVYSEDKSNDTYSEYILFGDSQDNDIVRSVEGFFWCQNSVTKNYSGV